MATIRPARPGDLPALRALLEAVHLPTEGMEAPHVQLWIAEEGGRVAGVIGLEVYGDAGLLRSAAVTPAAQGTGVGAALVRHLLAQAKDLGIGTVSLLTETAESWFLRFGFRVVSREEVDTRVRQSTEFRGVCPETAVAMVADLGGSGPSPNPSFRNVYADATRADAYASLEFAATYGLAFRDIPDLLARHVTGRRALDFGCGAGRSTRFLQRLGYETVGVDIAEEMLDRARLRDPDGRYHRIPDTGPGELEEGPFDLILSAFAFDNIPTFAKKMDILSALRRHLAPTGRLVNLVSSPDIYRNEWVSFSTKDFPENRAARSGDTVHIVMLDVEDSRPVEDAYWTEEDYQKVHRAAGLVPLEVHRPLGLPSDGVVWKTETTISPWAIHVLAPVGREDR